MRKLAILALAMACLLMVGGVALARDPAEVLTGVPDALREPLDALTSGQYTFLSGYRDLDEGNERAILLLDQGGVQRIYILKNTAGVWQQEAVSSPVPAIPGVQAQVEGWAGFFWLNYQYTNNDGKAAQLTYDITLQGDVWRIINFSLAIDGQSAVHADFRHKYAPNMMVENVYERLPGLYDNDLRTIDFPQTAQDVRDATTLDGLAMVNNPLAKDRLNLRKEPKKDAKSLGKYYNGTIVKVLDDRGDGWVHVDIEGETGYVMREFLAFGKEAAARVPMPDIFMQKLVSQEPGVAATMYQRPDTASTVITTVAVGDGVFVLGDIGEEWSHVVYEYTPGFVQTQYLTFGNG